jgi:hypothetical protein
METERLLLASTNDRKLMPRVLEFSGLTQSELTLENGGSYGAAVFASRTEVLSVRRPLARGESMFGQLDEQLRMSRMLAIGDGSPDRPFAPHRLMPYRYKGWVFAFIGDRPAAEQPQGSEREVAFVSQNGGTESPSHRFMARVMYRVQRATQGATDPDAPALRTAILDAAANVAGFNRYAIALTTEQSGIVVSQGMDVFHRAVTVKAQNPFARDEELLAVAHLKGSVIVVGTTPAGRDWKRLDEGKSVSLVEVGPPRIF